jgi:hypothetical protein
MEKYNTIEKEWIKSLTGNDPSGMIATIHEIRNSGSVRILPYLFELINLKTDARVRNEVLKLLSEIKTREAVPLIVESIDKYDFGEFLPAIIASCWQSGLDFSTHLPVFARLFVQGDYITALESFTVIEESIEHCTDEIRTECVRLLNDNKYFVSDEKLPLFHELIKVIEEI